MPRIVGWHPKSETPCENYPTCKKTFTKNAPNQKLCKSCRAAARKAYNAMFQQWQRQHGAQDKQKQGAKLWKSFIEGSYNNILK
jgi:hypothetical protein